MKGRRLALGLATLLGIRRRGFFIPYRYADQIPEAGRLPPYPALAARLAAGAPAMAEVLDWIDGYAADLDVIGSAAARTPPPAPRWDQDWFPRLDAAVAYTLVRRLKPSRIVEIGSGHSSRFLARAITDAGLATRHTAIDPAPRAVLQGLALELMRCTLQDAGLAPFEALEPGDFLVVDSSHILMPGSDVDVLLGRILPLLPAGVVVHFHDIFLPDDYPADWAWRGYNEQNAILPLLLTHEVLFASLFALGNLAAAERSALRGLALPPGARESSIWMRLREAPS